MAGHGLDLGGGGGGHSYILQMFNDIVTLNAGLHVEDTAARVDAGVLSRG